MLDRWRRLYAKGENRIRNGVKSAFERSFFLHKKGGITIKEFTKAFAEAIRMLNKGDFLLWGTNSNADPLEVFEVTEADERYKYVIGRLTLDYSVFDVEERINATTIQLFEFREGAEVLAALNNGETKLARKYRDAFSKWKNWNFVIGVPHEKVGSRKSFTLDECRELSIGGVFSNFNQDN